MMASSLCKIFKFNSLGSCCQINVYDSNCIGLFNRNQLVIHGHASMAILRLVFPVSLYASTVLIGVIDMDDNQV